MENELPSRFEETYCKKMKFDKYEYTNFIAYELARRNTNVMNLLNLSFELIAFYNTLLLSYNGHKGTDVTEEILENINSEEWLKETISGLLEHYNKNNFSNEINNLTLENIKEVFLNIINKIAQELYEKYYVIYQNDLESLEQSAKELYDPLIFLERDRCLTEHMNRVYEGEENHKKNYSINYTENKYFAVYQEIPKNQKDFSFYTIYPKFKYAMRDFTDTKVAINLNLTEAEIVDYIKKIKKNYDSKNSIVKTKRELLEEELGELDDIKSFTIDKWADNFFIYDYFLYHKVTSSDKTDSEIKREIQIELTKFHGVRVAKSDDEIKSDKDRKFKYMPLEEYKTNEWYNQDDDVFETLLDENQAMNIKTIGYKYELMNNYIQGENPLYKTLLEK